ncbi:PRC-barrel domain-containing protein [Pseudoroseomonas cervicalis]|uniref:PRC-barrel domain-containing protein n=1 Tax=Teichococcus cervicalis TaxID=204525 RepID=UPI0022F19984|nr:PRC-barrel domain-containing protein [Pseudoroseomonas cervicalis]WBV45384.1 PRC-barrel domain-containing protein [Pseudoroseomonas cervicalis]
MPHGTPSAAAPRGTPPPEAPPAAPAPDPVPTVPPPEAEPPRSGAASPPAAPRPASPPQGGTPAAPPPAPADSEPVPQAARETLPRAGLFRVLGQDVRGSSNNVVGQVVNVLVDPEGRPRVAVLDYGGFLGVGRRRIAVAWAALNFSPDGIRLGLGRDQLKAFPEYREGEDVTFALPPPARPVAGNPE